MNPSRLILAKTDELFPLLVKYRIVIVEGARCVGKDHLIERFTTAHPAYLPYEVMKPRKKFMDEISGSLHNLPGGIDIQQSHLWTMDVFRQFRDLKVVVNRSMLTSQHFDGQHEERFTMWQNLLKTVNGIVVLVNPPDRSHAKRIASAGRLAETESIYAEKIGIQRFAAMLDPARLCVFSEV